MLSRSELGRISWWAFTASRYWTIHLSNLTTGTLNLTFYMGWCEAALTSPTVRDVWRATAWSSCSNSGLQCVVIYSIEGISTAKVSNHMSSSRASSFSSYPSTRIITVFVFWSFWTARSPNVAYTTYPWWYRPWTFRESIQSENVSDWKQSDVWLHTQGFPHGRYGGLSYWI